MEDTQNIKMRQKTNLSVYTVSRPKDVLMSWWNSGLWVY